jgi:hypothetical protein
MSRVPSLPTVRDAALVAAAAAVTAMAVDDLTSLSSFRRRPTGADAPPLRARHGWLHRVDQYGTGPVRPATEAEAAAARAAAAVDGGDGVFGRTFDSDTLLLPDDPAYARGGVSYYRVVPAPQAAR